MGHLLMVESWVGAMSTLLPRGIREAGHRFSFATRDLHHYLRSASGSDVHPLLGADNVLTTETNDTGATLDRLAALAPVLGVDGVVTSCDYYLASTARIARRLGLPGPPPEAVERACRKDLTRQTLHGAGAAGPAFALADNGADIEDAAASLGFPLVVKPVDLCAGMYVREVHDVAGLREAYRALREFPVNARGQRRTPTVLLEETLTGAEFSVETVTVRGHTTVVGVTDKSLAGDSGFVETGHMFPAALDSGTERRITAVALEAIEGLGLDETVCHTEVRLTPDGPRLIEVNPRPAGNRITELVRRVTGVDLAGVQAQVCLGEQPDLRPRTTGVGSAAISFLLPERAGVIDAVGGARALERADDVVDHEVPVVGRRTGIATSNNHYLGYVMVTHEQPDAARGRADSLVADLDVRYSAEGAEVLA